MLCRVLIRLLNLHCEKWPPVCKLPWKKPSFTAKFTILWKFKFPDQNISNDAIPDNNQTVLDKKKFFKALWFSLWFCKNSTKSFWELNCFCGMVDRRNGFSVISSRDHCQRSSPSRISYTPRALFESAQSLSSGLVEWSRTVVVTATWQPRM